MVYWLEWDGIYLGAWPGVVDQRMRMPSMAGIRMIFYRGRYVGGGMYPVLPGPRRLT